MSAYVFNPFQWSGSIAQPGPTLASVAQTKANVPLGSSTFPLYQLHTDTTSAGPTKTALASKLVADQVAKDAIPSAGAGIGYIAGHLGYVVVFILFTLGLYYTVGKKGTTYFLAIVILGQLVISDGVISMIQSFTNKKG